MTDSQSPAPPPVDIGEPTPTQTPDGTSDPLQIQNWVTSGTTTAGSAETEKRTVIVKLQAPDRCPAPTNSLEDEKQ